MRQQARGAWRRKAGLPLAAALSAALCAGCGINKSRLATEQLVVSDAVDKTVAGIDFSPLSGHKVFFDTQYLDGVNMGANGNVKYVISSLRQQMLAYDCRLQEKADTADYVVEARIGVLANDGHEVTYGIPGSAALASASVFLSSPVSAPALPELSLGRRNHQAGTAKIGVFAYDRATREPVWQAGVKKGTSEARDAWVLGLGPYQTDPLARQGAWRKKAQPTPDATQNPLAAFSGPVTFERALRRGSTPERGSGVVPAGHQVEASGPEAANASAAAPVGSGVVSPAGEGAGAVPAGANAEPQAIPLKQSPAVIPLRKS